MVQSIISQSTLHTDRFQKLQKVTAPLEESSVLCAADLKLNRSYKTKLD